MAIDEITVEELKQKLSAETPPQLLDVREQQEYDFAHIDGSILIPLNQLPKRMDELDKGQELAVLCHHGMRSLQAAHFLAHHGFKRIANVKGGIDAWSLRCDPKVKRY